MCLKVICQLIHHAAYFWVLFISKLEDLPQAHKPLWFVERDDFKAFLGYV